MNILAIGAHPDDIEYGCGGALLRYADDGHAVHLLIATNGEQGGDPKIRKQEQLACAHLLGAREVFWGECQDTRIPVDMGLISTIEKVVKKVKPAVIFSHAPSDTHQDHRNLSSATMSATRYSRNVLFFEVPTTHDFMPTVFVDIGSVIRRKLALLEAHASQINKTNIPDMSILATAQANATFRGSQARVKFAEGFLPVRLFLEP